ncbi:hypothetical protein HJB56_05090 [Rhizobium lentis]|uniref:hypothetical protein n=1 Tax=Rhizobium lentis TaxID=1138194 RepID=UPI001C83991B|nr:hypothetical protein [Rhizobium lentis]MBX5082162.1 hypothetical protein [Rhizobium lentis]MBX5094872.1 hypothetical protein [Rhizobium lentis]MBX5119597.1 hypothetical protein [Rhizobium lentis]
MSEDIYIPAKKGERIPMPGNMPDWPEDGRPVNFTSPYEARLVRDGTLKKKAAKGGSSEGEK